MEPIERRFKGEQSEAKNEILPHFDLQGYQYFQEYLRPLFEAGDALDTPLIVRGQGAWILLKPPISTGVKSR